MIGFVVLTGNVNIISQGQDEDWSEPTEITKYDYTYIPSPTSIVVNSEDDWHVVYSDRVRYENNSQRQFIKYINSSSTEVLAEVLYDLSHQSGEIIGFPSIALDRDGGLHVTYTYYSFDDQFNQFFDYN
jgi:kynureninase